MSREVRRVPLDWQHPMEWRNQWDRGQTRMMLVPKPLFGRSFAEALAEFQANPEDYDDREPDPADYMPEFPEGSVLGYAMYETVSEGTPISPVCHTPEGLAHWLADTGASAFGEMTATYEQWLAVVRGGWAPSAVTINGGATLKSGVEFVGDRAAQRDAAAYEAAERERILADIAAELEVDP